MEKYSAHIILFLQALNWHSVPLNMLLENADKISLTISSLITTAFVIWQWRQKMKRKNKINPPNENP